MAVRTETRIDSGELLQMEERADGSILAHGVLARPGIYLYRRADGSSYRELVDDSVLADADWLATVARGVVTLEHPPEPVSPDNFSRYSVGDADGEVETDDRGFVRIKIAARRADAVRALRSGIRGLSPGYSVEVDSTPGVHPRYGAFDTRQVKRLTNNHTAICQYPRGGSACELRVDAVEVDPMDPKVLMLLRQHLKRDSMGEEEVPSVLEALLGELIGLRSDAAACATLRTDMASMQQRLADAEARCAAYAAKEAAGMEQQAQADARAVAERHAVTLTATDAAGMQRELVKAIFTTDADDSTLPGLYLAAKALEPRNGWKPTEPAARIVTDAIEFPPYRGPYRQEQA